MTTQSKAEKKILKAVYLVDKCVNNLNEHGVYDVAKARRKAASYNYWLHRANKFACVNGKLI